MRTITVQAKKDHLEKVAKTNQFNALAELIWNGFDAGSSRVYVDINRNELGGIDSIAVSDQGCGIDFDKLTEYFGQLGGSWKRKEKLSLNNALHGQNGEGRYKAYTIGTKVTWDSVYAKDNKKYNYQINGDVNNIEVISNTEPVETNERLGTKVLINNIYENIDFDFEETVENLAKFFCFYLSKYSSKKLLLNMKPVEPSSAQESIKNYDLGEIHLCSGKSINLNLSIIQWKSKSDRIIYFCDRNGFVKGEYRISNKFKGANNKFSIHAFSDYFDELANHGTLENQMDEDTKQITEKIINKVREHFINIELEDKGKIIESWIAEGIYPYGNLDYTTEIKKAERQVFDILAVNVSSYLDKFDKQDTKTKKFTFQLLKQAIENNPESVQKILSEVLELKKEEQDDLAKLLEKTSLSSIIKSAQIVANRLDFIQGLENLVFDLKTRKSLKERDQLHKILENETWLFNEDFYLAGSEKRLEEVLEKHIGLLGDRVEESTDSQDPVLLSDGKQGRIDLMFSKTRKPSEDTIEHLIIELKRPSKKIDSDVLTQIEKYAIAVCSDERFSHKKVKWTFIAVSNQMDDLVKRKARQRDRLEGLIFSDSEFNVEVWVMTWSEIIHKARVRLNFFANQLNYDASRDSASSYLHKVHGKFIPKLADKP